MATKKSRPVVGYVRVSRVSGREGDTFISPELQRESIERVCKREDLKLVRFIEELDASGGDASRPGWLEAIQEVESGKAHGLVVWNLSRFSRSVVDALGAIERIEAAGGKLYSEEGNLDKLSRVIRLAISEDERDRAKAGFRAAQENAIAKGIYIAGRVPFGYVRDESRRLAPDPATAPLVVELFERRAAKQSWTKLAEWMTEQGYPKARRTVEGIIHNPAYIGVARTAYGLRNERAHEALVSRRL
jgi:DNA invertase Pin-like site-specific DNA recombinase